MNYYKLQCDKNKIRFINILIKMLNYLNQEKNLEGKTSIRISMRKVIFVHH